ncbi:MAG: AbrB/MazE/SpoVT family DNA-binding domain-containing protein [Betaproteobacteria bacterium]|nr:AbrB/MazE/SpoVT family DNA-binding domain-containing protein [Betaproteobacteria bacterium]
MATSIRVFEKGTVKVSSAGALSIPRSMLESVDVEPGTEFTIEADGYGLRLAPVVSFPPKTVDEVGGCLHRPGRKAKTDDELNAAVRARAKANDKATRRGK